MGKTRGLQFKPIDEVGEDILGGRSILQRLVYHCRNEQNVWRWLLSRVLLRMRLSSLLVINRGSYKIRLFPTSYSIMAWDGNTIGRRDERVLLKYLRAGDVFVDVGANIGLLSLCASRLVDDVGLVVAIEAHPATFGYLDRNVRFNKFKNVKRFNVALGDKNGEVGFTSIDQHDDNNRAVPEGDLRVPLTTLDNLLRSETRTIRFLKVDVEGFEKFVFLGARNLLKRVEVIYFEVSEAHFAYYGYKTSDVLQILAEYDFKCFAIQVDGREERVPLDFVPDACMNLIAHR